jgi:hypothetical protein
MQALADMRRQQAVEADLLRRVRGFDFVVAFPFRLV